MTLGVFGRPTSQRTQETDRLEARQERIGAAPRRDKVRKCRQPELPAEFERHVEPAVVGTVGAGDRIVGAGDARILQAKIQPIAGHRLELGAEARAYEVAEQAPFRFVSVTRLRRIIGVRRIIGWAIGHPAPYKAPAVIRYPLYDLPTSRVAPADMGSMGAAGIPVANVIKIR